MILKKLVMILLCFAFVCVVLLVKNSKKNSFIKTGEIVSFSYNKDNISYVEISDKGRLGKAIDGIFKITINSREDISKIVEHLNSLNLIEYELAGYTHIPDLNKVGYFTIMIAGVDDTFEFFEFKTDTMVLSYSDYDYKSYYIENSDYDGKTMSNKTYRFLYNLINK